MQADTACELIDHNPQQVRGLLARLTEQPQFILGQVRRPGYALLPPALGPGPARRSSEPDQLGGRAAPADVAEGAGALSGPFWPFLALSGPFWPFLAAYPLVQKALTTW